MYICSDCGSMFTELGSYEERHGFTHGPFEKFSCCPVCKSTDFDEAVECPDCGEHVAADTLVSCDDDIMRCEDCAATYLIESVEPINDTLAEGLEEILCSVYAARHINTGDITPEQQSRWDSLLDELGTLFTELVEQNGGTDE